VETLLDMGITTLQQCVLNADNKWCVLTNFIPQPDISIDQVCKQLKLTRQCYCNLSSVQTV